MKGEILLKLDKRKWSVGKQEQQVVLKRRPFFFGNVKEELNSATNSDTDF